MRDPDRLFVLPALAAGVLFLFLAGCSWETEAEAPAPKLSTAPGDPNVFDVQHPEQFPLAQIETRRIPNQLSANGVVSPDVSLTVHVTSPAGGRVIDIHARLGDEVRKGQVLVVVRSQDLELALSEYRKSITDELLAHRALDRAKLLLDHGAIAAKELEIAQDAEDKAKVDLETGAERIRLLGGDVNQQSPVIEVRAPSSGVIVEQNTASGEGIRSLDNSPSLFTIAELSRIWVLCDVYENQLPQVHVGDRVDVLLNAYPDRTFKGRISNISPILDLNTRTAKVRIELANSGRLFRPGMFATARFTSQGTREQLAVPASALLRLHDKDWVFRQEGNGRFRRLEVQSGPSLPDGFQVVLAGLRVGDRVVSNALQFASAIEQK